MGYEISIPRADITARLGDNLSKSELFVLHISGTVLKPIDTTGTSPQTVAPKISLYRDPALNQ